MVALALLLAVPTTGLAVPTTGLAVPTTGLAVPTTGLAVPTTGLAVPTTGLAVPTTGLAVPTTGLGAPETGPLTLDVPIYLGAELREEVLSSALRETARIFEPGGIELRFDVSPDDSASRPLVTVMVQPRPARFKVHGCSRDRHDHRLGHTQLRSRRITLWSEQVARAVDGNWDRKELPNVDDRVYAQALGRVLAHELGHLLLRLNGHRDRGLMRSAFSHRSLTARGRRAFRLAEEDLQAIRETLLHAVAKNKKRLPSSPRREGGA